MEPKFNNENDEFEAELQEMATKKVQKLKGFYSHMIVYIIGLIIYVLKEYFDVPFHFFPIRFLNGFVMCIWTTAFLVSTIDIFASFKIFGQDWEERKLKSILDKKVKKQKWE
ncbi:2TM domain-containing protein [Flavobacterium sp. KACC 22761]|uniref:2TM domain-containing protein n=1 Tax=Flavobacterium sp. KACC 22761 TaxID=3092665 RepID=UPI002A75B9AE|nr:2TM domain-containing protein [Flavobacterium sp. KACC 22761]WPO78992.1 2TM domain-containing protein [Flavobacterium sp. KACC 22761]